MITFIFTAKYLQLAFFISTDKLLGGKSYKSLGLLPLGWLLPSSMTRLIYTSAHLNAHLFCLFLHALMDPGHQLSFGSWLCIKIFVGETRNVLVCFWKHPDCPKLQNWLQPSCCEQMSLAAWEGCHFSAVLRC